jgi:hypoxanthine phosphoribosyltransferase/acetylornithine deacetylase/succinyl-diaminopimelate desuccinylase-like protein
MRAIDRLNDIAAIAQYRPGYSPEEDAAHELAAGWMRQAGLETHVDTAGNLHGRRGPARVWSGSHLDSVPTAGRFDGVLGVVAAIEAAERLPEAPLGVVVFRAEENGPHGSRGVEELPEAFLELHVEQGPVLESLGEPLGIVTGVAGQAHAAVTFEGRADHAGTTPMDARNDALVAAARFVLHVRECALDGAVATVGAVEVEPNAANVVPARVTVSVDARARTAGQLEALVAAIGFEPGSLVQPVAFSGPPLEALRRVLPGAPELVSGAGHDAMVLASAGVPAAMLFVRSLNGGVSHHPDELSSDDDVAQGVGARSLAEAVVADGYRPDLILGIARGGLLVAGAVGYALGVKNTFTMNVEFYTGVDERLDMPMILPPVPELVDFESTRVLVADDVADTGETLKLVKQFCADKVGEVRCAVLYEKPRSAVRCEYVWRRTDQWITFPWSADEPVQEPVRSGHAVG